MTNPLASTPITGSRLALLPGTTPVPGNGANSEPPTTIADQEKAARRALLAVDAALRRGGEGYHAWLDHIWSAAACTRPVRLSGLLHCLDATTGEVRDTISTATLPDGTIYKACGNRRHSVCPTCATTYQRDAYQLVRAGLVGGKTVPDSVAQHPAVFATFTAPSFGLVHTRHVRNHRARCEAKPGECSCPAEPCHARRNGDGSGTAQTCQHGVKLACFTRHRHGDEQLGQPLCADCYDHDHHVVWNRYSGELWRRTKQAIERRLNQLARTRGLAPAGGRTIRVSHGKAAEYQARGAVHFHVLLRLDGIDPADPDAVIPPPAGLTIDDLYDAVHAATSGITFTTPPHPARPDGWPMNWGRQLDVRPITLTGHNALNDSAVAGYLAKYATKSTEPTGHTSPRLDHHNIALYADPHGTHPQRLIAACWNLGDSTHHPEVNEDNRDEGPYEGLRRWAHMLGFGGHFLTKARRYSVTFARLRGARIRYARTQATGPTYTCDLADPHQHDEETTLIIGDLTYAGRGWLNQGDALLANTAAAQARDRQQAGREELTRQPADNPHLQAA
ncbi:replication initiator [Spirillospora sp. NPDC047279]|uniref:replication initiator n=1 Tax=Spirillospora sp. NPDC047279 TaxID=3155478 RepID=UPI00340BC859